MQFPYKNKIDKLLSKFVDFTGADEGYLPKLRKRRPLGRASQLSLLARTVHSRQYFIRTTQNRTQLWVRSRVCYERFCCKSGFSADLNPAEKIFKRFSLS